MVLRRVVNELGVLAGFAAAMAVGSLIGFAATGTDALGLVLGAGLGAVFWTGIGYLALRRAAARTLDGAPSPAPGATFAAAVPQAVLAGLVYVAVVGGSEVAALGRRDHTPTLAGVAIAVAILLGLQWRGLRAVERRDGVEVWRAGRQLFVRPAPPIR